jgi:glycosyltransferase involved in cell wall biosynthesis
MSASVIEESPARPFSVRRRATVAADGLRLSVVVPSYNTAPFIAQTIRSVLEQTVTDLELIVVDDGSSDESVAIIDAIRDPRVTCVQQSNRGLAGARNTGILLSRAETIGFCDADDVWYPHKAERHLALMEANPQLGLTFSFSEYLAEDGTPTGQLLLTRCRQPTMRDLILRNHIGNGSTPIVRKDVFRRAGLFDETLGSCEDYEMWVRSAACTSLGLGLLPEVLTGYRVRPGSMTTSYDSFLQGHRLALERFRTYVPGFTHRDAARSYAECLRIASRKAFSNGQVTLSRRLFLAAVRYAPLLPVRDARAFGMLMLHLLALPLPARAQPWTYRVALRVMRKAFAAYLMLGRRPATPLAWPPVPRSAGGEPQVCSPRSERRNRSRSYA